MGILLSDGPGIVSYLDNCCLATGVLSCFYASFMLCYEVLCSVLSLVFPISLPTVRTGDMLASLRAVFSKDTDVPYSLLGNWHCFRREIPPD
jgi:hypothetical protein